MDVLKKVAKAHSVTEKEVQAEMMNAIRLAKNNPDPEARKAWNKLFPDGKEPTVEEFIKAVMQEVKAKSNKTPEA